MRLMVDKNIQKIKNEQILNKIQYNSEGYYVHKKQKKDDFKVTVILTTFNSENSINKAINSVISQSLGFNNVELLIIDDFSTDSTRSLILDWSNDFNNIIPIFLESNTGSPSKSRNLGIKLAKGKYLLFLDDDDWLDVKGTEVLYNLMEINNTNYAIGRALRHEYKGVFIRADYNTWTTRASINPLNIQHVFRHLGPAARMMNTQFIQENNFKFPNMKFAEDKQFFIEVLSSCGNISTSKEVVYHINRFKENQSLTTTTTKFDKMETNLSVMKYIKKKHYPNKLEKMIFLRLFELDFISRFLASRSFLNAEDKTPFYEKFNVALSIIKSLDYDLIEELEEDWHKILINLFEAARFNDIITLVDWYNNKNIKEYLIKDKVPYYKLPIADKPIAKTNMLASHQNTEIVNGNELIIKLEIYGKYLDYIKNFHIQQRNNELNNISFPIIKIDDNLFEVHIPFETIRNLEKSKYAVYITHFDYRKLPVRMNVRKISKMEEKIIDFYTTTSDNFALNITQAKK